MSAPRRLWILGSGKRVCETALPALARLSGVFDLRGIFARTAKTIHAEGRPYNVAPIDAWKRDELAQGDLVFMAVAKKSVPSVLRRIRDLRPPSLDLFIDTPVLLYKHMGALPLFAGFRSVSVAEDCTELPCWDPVRRAVSEGRVGELSGVELVHSAYAYHGFAMAKCILGDGPVRRAFRKRGAGGRRRITLSNGRTCEVHDPRDYARGRIRVVGSAGAISDEPGRPDALAWSAIVERGECRGFRVGELDSVLDEDERSLVGPPLVPEWEGAGVTVWMEGQKRVGFLRLLRRIAAGGSGYPLSEALDDTTVDYHLERVGLYLANPLTSPRFAPARFLLRGLTRVAGA